MDQRGLVSACEVFPQAGFFKSRLQSRDFGAAGRQLCVEQRELRPNLRLEIADRLLKLIAGGNLFQLACLDGLQIGENDVSQKVSKGCKWVVHEEILLIIPLCRTITNGGHW